MAKLYFYYSTMNAGKSTALLQADHNYEERGMRTLLYTAQLDSRDAGRIHSRIGIQREARHFHPALDLRAEIGAEQLGLRSQHGLRPVDDPVGREDGVVLLGAVDETGDGLGVAIAVHARNGTETVH